MIYTAETLPSNDTIDRYTYCVNVQNEFFISKGKMIAYYGQLNFEALGSDVLDILVKEAFNAPKYINDFVVVNGQGKMLLADDRKDTVGYNLEDANLTIKANHLIGFSSTLRCEESLINGYLTLLGTGVMIASSNGPVHFLEPPARVSQGALLGWADIPSPSYYYDYHYADSFWGGMAALAAPQFVMTGEEKQINFVGKGTVLVQSSE